MTELTAPYAPDWVSPPGDTILDIIEERNWSQAELATRLGYSEKHVSQLVNGKVPLSDETAMRLERVLGSKAGFWLAREAKYREHCARLESERARVGWVEWLDCLPLKALMGAGAIPKTTILAKNKPGLVDACLRFFGVASPQEWRNHYGAMEISYRRSRQDQSDVGAISTWLRLGEQRAEESDGPKYDKVKFEKALKSIRSLTSESPTVFEPRMRKLLVDAGVSFVMVPSISGAHVSGVARWLNPTRPLIQLSLYGKTNDKFWFTFFHEAAHILLHATSQMDKKSVFLDDPNASHTDDPKEVEANQWAGDHIIPRQYNEELTGLKTKTAVVAFAERVGVHPGIVVGRLQHDELIPPSWMNDLKVSFSLTKAAHA